MYALYIVLSIFLENVFPSIPPFLSFTLLPLSLPSPTPSPQKHYNLDITMLSYDVSILYAFFMNPAKVKERMNMP